jgi:hypothetical protein
LPLAQPDSASTAQAASISAKAAATRRRVPRRASSDVASRIQAPPLAPCLDEWFIEQPPELVLEPDDELEPAACVPPAPAPLKPPEPSSLLELLDALPGQDVGCCFTVPSPEQTHWGAQNPEEQHPDVQSVPTSHASAQPQTSSPLLQVSCTGI